MARDNVELKKEIIQVKTQQQKIQIENAKLGNNTKYKIQTECNEKTNEINKINKEQRQAERELTQLIKKLDIKKENNVNSNKKSEDQKNESEKQIATLKTMNLGLENKINSKNMNNETTTAKQDQQHLQQSNREIKKKEHKKNIVFML